MENFRKAREEEEANRVMRAAKKLQEDQDAEEVSHVASSRIPPVVILKLDTLLTSCS